MKMLFISYFVDNCTLKKGLPFVVHKSEFIFSSLLLYLFYKSCEDSECLLVNISISQTD